MNLIVTLFGYFIAGFALCLLLVACAAYYQQGRRLRDAEWVARRQSEGWAEAYQELTRMAAENGELKRRLEEKDLFPEYING